MTIRTDYDEPYGRVLPFRNDFAPPRALTMLEEARLIIESSVAHARAVVEGRSRRIDVSGPSDAPSVPAATPEPWIRAELTPPLMDSRERAESDSTNGRMHKLISKD